MAQVSTSTSKMVLNVQQQVTVTAWAIAYQNNRKAVRLAKCDFHVLFLPLTIGKWRKRLLTMGSIHKTKPPGRPRSSTDAAATAMLVEAFVKSPQKSTHQDVHELHITQSSVSRVLRHDHYRTFKLTCVHELKEAVGAV